MTREEEINEAVNTYMNGLFEDGVEMPIEDFENIEEGFIAGAHWADNHPINVWHDAYEKPAGRNWEILYEDESGNHWVVNKCEAFTMIFNWQKFTKDATLTRWAYVADLLPKGGEE